MRGRCLRDVVAFGFQQVMKHRAATGIVVYDEDLRLKVVGGGPEVPPGPWASASQITNRVLAAALSTQSYHFKCPFDGIRGLTMPLDTVPPV
jgi:hypothetical protein